MSEKQVFRIDADACASGGRTAGEWLESIGKGDVFDLLTKEEWDMFCLKLVGSAFIAAVGPAASAVFGDEVPF